MSPESHPKYVEPLTAEEGLEDYYAEKQTRLDEIHDRWISEAFEDSIPDDNYDDIPY